MIGPSYEEQHREDEGGGERDNPVHMGREAQRKITRHETYLIEEAIEYRYGDEMGGGERDQCDVSDTVELQNYLPQVKMTGGPVDDSWAWTKLRYLTSSAIRAILQHLRGTRRRRLWRSVWDAKAGLPGIFGRWYCNVPWGCLTEETQRRYVAKATVWLERDQLPTEEDCWAALATVDRLNTHNFDYYRDGRGYRPIEALTRRRDKRHGRIRVVHALRRLAWMMRMHGIGSVLLLAEPGQRECYIGNGSSL
jgi:hypothetical protein